MPDIILRLPNSDEMHHKVSVIKAIRSLTGLNLKAAKGVSDDLAEGKTRKITIRDNAESNAEHLIELESNGIIIEAARAVSGNVYVRDIRNLAVRALKNGDYTVAQEVIELLKKLDPNGV